MKLEDRVLHVSIKTEHSEDQTDEKNGQNNFCEYFMGEFRRVLMLPGPAKPAKKTTDYHNDVLAITIPMKNNPDYFSVMIDEWGL